MGGSGPNRGRGCDLNLLHSLSDRMDDWRTVPQNGSLRDDSRTVHDWGSTTAQRLRRTVWMQARVWVPEPV